MKKNERNMIIWWKVFIICNYICVAETIIPDETIRKQELVESNGFFTYRCRCGDDYILNEEDLTELPVYVQCESCSLYLCVNWK